MEARVAVERFELESTAKWTLLAAPWIFGGFVLLGVALPFLPDDGRPRNLGVVLAVSVPCTIFFALLAIYSVRSVRRMPSYPVCVDAEGLWPAAAARSGSLVRWSDVAEVRERQFLQRLELRDRAGKCMIRLEYQLRDFDRLRALVQQRAGGRAPPVARGVFEKSWFHHAFSIGATIGFVGLGLFVAQERPLFGIVTALLLGAVLTWEYYSTVYRVQLTPGRLKIFRPGRVLEVHANEIARVDLADTVANHAKHPVVTLVFVPPRGPIKLRALGVSAMELQRALMAWRSSAV